MSSISTSWQTDIYEILKMKGIYFLLLLRGQLYSICRLLNVKQRSHYAYIYICIMSSIHAAKYVYPIHLAFKDRIHIQITILWYEKRFFLTMSFWHSLIFENINKILVLRWFCATMNITFQNILGTTTIGTLNTKFDIPSLISTCAVFPSWLLNTDLENKHPSLTMENMCTSIDYPS